MATSAKSLRLAAELADELAKRLAALGVVSSISASSGFPLIQVGTSGAGNPGGLIRVRPVDWSLTPNIIGSVNEVYTPHVIQLVTEANPSLGAGADVNTPAQLLAMLGACLYRGTRVEWWNSASGVAPTETTLGTGTNLKASYESLYYPMTSTQ